MPELETTGVCVAMQVRTRPGIEVPIDPGEQQPHAARAAGKILRCPQDGIVRCRLDGGAGRAGLSLGYGVDDTDRVRKGSRPVSFPAPRIVVAVGELASPRLIGQLGCAADAPANRTVPHCCG